MSEPVLSRRAWLTGLASGAGALAAACQSSPGVTETTTPQGTVLRYEGVELVVLVSGFERSYTAGGEPVRAEVLLNNQSAGVVQARVRTRLLGRGEQAVAEAEVANVTIPPGEVGRLERELPLGRSLNPGDYTLSVELPPWRLNGRETGRGATLRTGVTVVGERGPP